MATWREVEREAPALAGLARGLFEAHQHKTLATLRRDGSPRISGIQIEFSGEDLFYGIQLSELCITLDTATEPSVLTNSDVPQPPAPRSGI